MRKIAILMLLAACGAPNEPEEEILPPERSVEEAGIDETGGLPNITTAPPAPENYVADFAERMELQSARGAIGRGGLDRAGGGIIRSEALHCDKDTLECDTSVGFYENGVRLTDEQVLDLQLPAEPQHFGEVQGELPNYWATSQIASASATSSGRTGGSSAPAIAPSPSAACVAGEDFCKVGFTPWCNGGAGKVSPGGITETATGCRGSVIKHGGFRGVRPDNANHRISYWGYSLNSCSDTTFAAAPELNSIINTLNNNDRVLPPPFTLSRVGCGANGRPPGFIEGTCTSGLPCITPGVASVDGTLADVVFSYASLQTNAVDLADYCTEAGNTGPGFNRANAVTFGCAQELLERNASGPVIRSWGNGYLTVNYWTARGYYLTVDQVGINWWATRAANQLDRGGLNLATRQWYIALHVTSHELGHTLGLTHPYEGADGAPRWVTHSKLPNAMTPNPNMIPYSVMARAVPAAPWTLSTWSSGLQANLGGYDSATAGAGNAEAWRMSNAFRSTDDGIVNYPINTFWPPQPETNGEL